MAWLHSLVASQSRWLRRMRSGEYLRHSFIISTEVFAVLRIKLTADAVNLELGEMEVAAERNHQLMAAPSALSGVSPKPSGPHHTPRRVPIFSAAFAIGP